MAVQTRGLEREPSKFGSGAGGVAAVPAIRPSLRRLRVRGSAVALFGSGVALAIVALACVSAAIRVSHPIAHGFMYLWFAALSFFAAWVSQTQARPTD